MIVTTSLFSSNKTNRFAILDFDNISGIEKYNGLGKAMSSMLISDLLENPIPETLKIIERSQISKILAEQKLQKTASFDKNQIVSLGKILGVRYLLVGDIFILDGTLIINSRLINVETAEILFSDKSEGDLVKWLSLKTELASNISKKLNIPFSKSTMIDKPLSMVSLVNYSKAITAVDNKDYEKANILISMLKEYEPNFDYLRTLSGTIKKLQRRLLVVEHSVDEIKLRLDIIEKRINSGKITDNPSTLEDYIVNAIIYFNNGSYINAEKMFNEIFKTNYIKYDLAYKYYESMFYNYAGDLNKILNKINGLNKKAKLFCELAGVDYNSKGFDFFTSLEKYSDVDQKLKLFLIRKRSHGFVGIQNQVGYKRIYNYVMTMMERSEELTRNISEIRYLFHDIKFATIRKSPFNIGTNSNFQMRNSLQIDKNDFHNDSIYFVDFVKNNQIAKKIFSGKVVNKHRSKYNYINTYNFYHPDDPNTYNCLWIVSSYSNFKFNFKVPANTSKLIMKNTTTKKEYEITNIGEDVTIEIDEISSVEQNQLEGEKEAKKLEEELEELEELAEELEEELEKAEEELEKTEEELEKAWLGSEYGKQKFELNTELLKVYNISCKDLYKNKIISDEAKKLAKKRVNLKRNKRFLSDKEIQEELRKNEKYRIFEKNIKEISNIYQSTAISSYKSMEQEYNKILTSSEFNKENCKKKFNKIIAIAKNDLNEKLKSKIVKLSNSILKNK